MDISSPVVTERCLIVLHGAFRSSFVLVVIIDDAAKEASMNCGVNDRTAVRNADGMR